MNINVLSISQRWGVLLLIIECKLSGSLTQEVRCIAEYSVKARTPRKPKPLMLIFDFSKFRKVSFAYVGGDNIPQFLRG